MFETMGDMFFDALRQAAERHLERDASCLAALSAAARTNSPTTTIAAQDALASLDPAVLNAIMADAHKILRESPAGILGGWNPGAQKH